MTPSKPFWKTVPRTSLVTFLLGVFFIFSIIGFASDISEMGRAQRRDREGQDALQRLFYVGMTRARSTLYLATPASSDLAVSWTGLPAWKE